MDELLRNLTDAQREAVLHTEGPLLILAGPGSGKTRVVTHRIARMVAQGIPDHQILALTFTNKAADEMRNRLQRLAPGRSIWVGTFHRFCARLLRKYASFVGLDENFTIYDTGDSAGTLRRTLGQLKIDTATFTPESIARAISWAKNNLIRSHQYQPRADSTVGGVVQRIYPAYQARLQSANAVDFDDLLLHVAVLLKDNAEVRQSLDERYRFILVDEYQDTNLAQYAIARALSIDHPNLAATGDPDQSIYGWRGANLNNILEFERDFPAVRVVRLERNYRSTKRILSVAAELISHNLRRKQKALFTENGPGEPVRLVTYPTQKEEAEDIARQIAEEILAGRRRARDFAVFYRTNALSRSLEFALREAGVPYQMVNGLEFFQRKEIKDILAYLRLLNNPADEEALLRIINTPTRGIGKTTIERLDAYATRHGLTQLEAARRAGQIEGLGRRPAALVAAFVELFDRLAAVCHGPIEELLGHVLSETGLRKLWSASGDEEDEERLANIEELLTVAREFDDRYPDTGRLEAFLEETALVNDTDDWETQRDRVTLMTLHASKGLEFPVVYLVAVEEGLLPHERSRHNPEQLEEERRLMFVGITRAQERLQLSLARNRDFRGQRKVSIPSSFLMELPRGEMLLDGMGMGGGGVVVDFDAVHDEPTDDGVHPQYDEPCDGDCPDFRPSENGEGSGDCPDFRLSENGTVPFGPKATPDDEAEQACDAPSYDPSMAAQVGRAPFIPGMHLRTAADMAHGDRPRPATDPEAFQHGMVVLHSRHGLGRIVALSGSGPERTATIDFASASGRQKVALGNGDLRPVKGSAE